LITVSCQASAVRKARFLRESRLIAYVLANGGLMATVQKMVYRRSDDDKRACLGRNWYIS